jgi:hypothetical protein
MSVKKISSIIKKKNAIYDLNLDQRNNNRFLTGSKLQKFDFDQLPDYIKKNKLKFKKWL